MATICVETKGCEKKAVETMGIEKKTVALVPEHSYLDERTLEKSITEKKYDPVVRSINKDFIKYIQNILPKYLSQSCNTREIIENDFRIDFGVADDGHVIGFPVIDVDQMMLMIELKIEQSIRHIIELSVMKRNESQTNEKDYLFVPGQEVYGKEEGKNIENSYTYTYSKSHQNFTTSMDAEINNIMEKFKSLVKIAIKLTPVAEFDEYTPEIEPDLSKVVEEYKKKILNYSNYKMKKEENQKKWLYVKAPIHTILNTERRSELVEWLKHAAPIVVPDMKDRFPDLEGLIEELEKKTNSQYDYIEPDYKLIQATDIPSNKMLDYMILNLVTLYRNIGCEQLRKEASLYKMDPVVPPPSEPYTSISSCYIGSVMNDIGKTYPLYVCSISISNIEEFLKNVNLEHFYYENEMGFLMCQVRKIDIVYGTSIGPISVDKLI